MTQLEELETLDTVDKVVYYEGTYADYSAILNCDRHMEVITYYVKNLREEWRLVDYHTDEEYDNGYVLFERKE